MNRILIAISTLSLIVLAACGDKPATPEPAAAQAQLAPAPAPAPTDPSAQPAAEPAAQPGQAAVDGTAAPAQAPAQGEFKAEPGRQFIVTGLHVGTPPAVDAGEIRIKNPDALKFRVTPNSQLAPPGQPVGNDVQTPTTQGLRRPPFNPNKGQQPARGEGR